MSSIIDGIGDDGIEQLDENLRKWFKEKWVRFGPDGKIRGACARGSSKEGKPKCLPQSKAHSIGKKGRKYAAAKKRREDPNPERRGPAKNVATKKKTNESMNEDVGGNYLYHATSAGGLKSILQSGIVKAATGPQSATAAQTKMPTVSVTRSWGYASGSHAENQESGGIGRDAVLIFDRANIENNFKTLGTSQSRETRGTAFPHAGNLKAGEKARSYDVDNDGNLTSKDADEVFRRQTIQSFGKPASRQEVGQILGQAKKDFYYPKSGGEFEEAVVVPKGGLPIQRTLVGFWVNPESSLTKDPEIMNNPLRLEKTGPNKFVKASEKVMNEEKCPHCGGELVSEELMNEKQDACYRKVKSRYKVWPSAYASGALVQCRKKGAKNWGNKSKANENNVFKGLVDEQQEVSVLYIDGKPSTKYARDHDAKGDLERMKAKFPNKKFELKKEVREGVIVGHDANDPEVAILGGAGTYKLSNVKKKAQMEANELAKDVMDGKFKNSAINVKQLANTLNTIVAAEDEMEKGYFGEDYTGEFAAEVTPAINPYGGLKDKKVRGAIGEALLSEMPDTSGAVGVQPGGWRTYSPKPAGEIDEDTAYAGGMGQGGNAGQSYRKFKPKSAGTFKEDELDEACWKGYHKEGNKKMFGKTYPNCVKNTNEEEQLDEKCWDTHKQVGMKKKGGKMVPNCVPKESAIMKGLTGKRD